MQRLPIGAYWPLRKPSAWLFNISFPDVYFRRQKRALRNWDQFPRSHTQNTQIIVYGAMATVCCVNSKAIAQMCMHVSLYGVSVSDHCCPALWLQHSLAVCALNIYIYMCVCAVYYAERNMGLAALGIVIAGVHQMPQRASAAAAAVIHTCISFFQYIPGEEEKWAGQPPKQDQIYSPRRVFFYYILYATCLLFASHRGELFNEEVDAWN